MTDIVYEKIGGLEDPEWILKHCINKLFSSPKLIEKLERFVKEGYVAGELDWSIQKWSDEVGQDFDVEPYDGYMAYVGGDEHGYFDNEEYSSFHSEELLYSRISYALNWYANKNPDKLDAINRLRKLFNKK